MAVRGGSASALALAVAIVVAACTTAQAQSITGRGAGGTAGVRPNSPLYRICQDADLSTLCDLASTALNDPVVAQLNSPTFVGTIFAPTNKGFTNTDARIKNSLGVGLDNLPRNPNDVATLLKEHVVVGQALSSPQLVNNLKLKSALGDTLEVDKGYLWGTYIKGPRNTVTVTDKDILAGNSYIQKVDGAIVPKARRG